MARVPTYSTMFINDGVSSISKSVNIRGRGVAGDHVGVKGYKLLSSYNRWRDHTTFKNKENISRGAQVFSIEPRSACVSHVENSTSSSRTALHMDKRCESSSDVENPLEALESYLSKLQNEPKQQMKRSSEVEPSSLFPAAEKELVCLQNYLSKLNAIQSQGAYLSNKTTRAPYIVNYQDHGRHKALNLKPKNQEECSDLSLIYILASINIGVFLFEIASPVKNSNIDLLTLPSLYGAKINHLILDGEWWRLVTPMFLHCGILHVTLGFWVLLTFGPQVCKGYGSFTFFLIYLLGGISGNLTSFIHTAEPTVGGTGPVFAIIGAWLVYQIQNKDAIEKYVAESLFRKAIITTAFSFILSNFGPIDDWAHVGAMCIGIGYGFITCPTLQLDDDSSASASKTDQKDGIALVRKSADPLKSMLIFAIFILILSTLLLFVGPLENNFV